MKKTRLTGCEEGLSSFEEGNFSIVCPPSPAGSTDSEETMRVPCSPFRTVGEADKPGAEAKPSLLSPPAVEWERTNKIAGMPKASHRKRAFVAGFDDYSTKPLRAAVKDATDVHAALLRLGFESTLHTDLWFEEFNAAVRKFLASLQPGDVTFVYFAGHGVEAATRLGGYEITSNWWLAKSVPEMNDDLPRMAIDATTFLEQIEAKGPAFNIMVSDCCRDNPLPTYVDFVGKPISKMLPKRSLVAYACEPGQLAAERRGAGHNGYYAEQLLKHLETPELRVEDLFREVRQGVNEMTKHFSCGMQDPRVEDALRVKNATLACPAGVGVKRDRDG